MTALATTDDLTVRGISFPSVSRAEALLESVSAAIRDAAGCQISEQTSTITMWTEPSRRIELPSRPVTSVTSVLLDGAEITDWKLRGSSLWREIPWQCRGAIPSELTVTFTHGYTTVPEDIVHLTCMLTAAALNAATDGFAGHRGLSGETIDDYQASYTTGADEVIDPIELPQRTRDMLRRRFSGGGAVVMGGVR